MQLVTKNISIPQLAKMAEKMYESLVKAVVDIDKNIMLVDAELHADQEQELLDQGSKQEHLWGINLYPNKFNTEHFIEFDSMINMRPMQNNKSRGVENKAIQEKIKKIVDTLVTP